jgi:light-regulated signal transduction histidine kinase (bacteriophytochrome)
MSSADLPSQEWTSHYGLFMTDKVTPFPADQIPLVRAIRGESSVTEMFVRNPEVSDGSWIEVSASPLQDNDGGVRGGVAAFRDITERKAAQQQILKLNDELEARVVQRTTQLEEANKELEAFTYSVSHDLRAPLRHIAGFSSLLLEESGSTLDSQARHYLQRIQDGTHKMGTLVDELLSLARVGRQVASVQMVDLNSMVAEVMAMLKPEWESREVEWKIAQLPDLACDATLTKLVFQNLIGNALKYSRPRRPAVIEVGTTETGDQPIIFVRDNGVGFNMKYSDKLFGVFQRLHRHEDFEGTGVGLATVQRIVKKHGGRVWAEAELDKGATFYFTIETATVSENKLAASASQGA